MAFSYKRSITIDHTKVNNNTGGSAQTDFPVMVKISDATFKTVGNGGNVQNSNGYDIAFYSDSAGTTPLTWETDYYDGTNGIYWGWVKIPSLSATSDTVIYVFYGDASISTFQSTASNVWTSSYRVVYHFPNGTSLSASDSTSNAYTGTITAATAGAGQVDGGVVTSSSHYVTSPTITAPSGSVTMSAWFKTSSTGTYQMIISAINTAQYEVRINDTNKAEVVFNYPGPGSTVYTTITGSTTMTDGAWHYIAATYDGTNVRLYVDGAQVGSTSASGYADPFTVFRVGGRYNDNSFPFNGTIDEARIHTNAKSANWIVTEYANQNSPATFFTLGAETAVGGGGTTVKMLAALGVG